MHSLIVGGKALIYCGTELGHIDEWYMAMDGGASSEASGACADFHN